MIFRVVLTRSQCSAVRVRVWYTYILYVRVLVYVYLHIGIDFAQLNTKILTVLACSVDDRRIHRSRRRQYFAVMKI